MKKIILLGDSIRKGYDKYVQMAFNEKACVYYPKENCRFSSFFLRYISAWKDEFGCGDDVDCVHWNVGLWDSLVLSVDGEHLTPIEMYCYYVERICKHLRFHFPKAKIIFATSTPVIERLFKENKRFNCDIERYNDAAVEIVKKYGFVINDLYALTKDVPEQYHSDLTHFIQKRAPALLQDR